MAVNKVTDIEGTVLIDLTGDTVTADKVLQGYSFHDRGGNVKVGTLPSGGEYHFVNNKNYADLVRFFDYDGTVLYEYTISEANALTELPSPPSHSDIGLVFQEWNWTLEEIQNTTHSLDIGAIYDTDHHGIYLDIEVFESTSITLYLKGTSLDWGDGTTQALSTSSATTCTHTYSAGSYRITITSDTAFNNWSFGSASGSRAYFKRLFCGTYYSQITSYPSNYDLNNCTRLENITFAKTDGEFSPPSNFARPFYGHITFIAYPRSSTVKLYGYSMMSNALKNVSIPYNVNCSNIGSQYLHGSPCLENIIIDTSTISSSATQIVSGCKALKYAYIKARNGSVSQTSFEDCYSLTRIDVDMPSSLRQYFLQNCYLLPEIDLSNCTTMSQQCLNMCCSLKKLKFPLVTTFRFDAMGSCYNLEEVEAPICTSVIGSPSQLYNCKKVIFSGQQTPPNINFSSVGTLPIIFYVAPGTLPLYAAATNWSVLVAQGRVKELEATE